MPGELHKRIVNACLVELKVPVITAEDISHLPTKHRANPIPDLSRGKELALEVHIPPKKALESIKRYGDRYSHFILVLPMPSKIDEIWLYDMKSNTFARRLLTCL